MELLEKIERDLNDFQTMKKSLDILPKVLKDNINRVETIEEAIENLNEYERRIIQRTCIDKVAPKSLEKEFGCTFKKIYLDKTKTLKKLVRLMYGTELLKGDK